MHSAIKVTIFISLVLVAAFALSNRAHADEFNVEVPFSPQGWRCDFIENTNSSMNYQCNFQWNSLNSTINGELDPPSVDGCAHGFDRDGKTGECRETQELQEEAKAECLETECWNEPEPTLQEKRLEELLDIPVDELTGGEIAELTTLSSQDAHCKYDIPLWQQDGKFVVDVEEVNVNGTKSVQLKKPINNKAIELKNYPNLLNSITAYEECVAEGKLIEQERTKDLLKVPNSNDVFRYHSWTAYDIPEWSQSRVNQEANGNQELSSLNPICAEDSYYSKVTKDIYCNESIPTITNDVVEYESEADEKYQQYLEDGGESQAQELRKKAIQEKISELFRQMKALEKNQ